MNNPPAIAYPPEDNGNPLALRKVEEEEKRIPSKGFLLGFFSVLDIYTIGKYAPQLAAGSRSLGEPRGYDPSVAGRGFMPRLRKGGREPGVESGSRWKGERKAVPPPRLTSIAGWRYDFPRWATWAAVFMGGQAMQFRKRISYPFINPKNTTKKQA